MKKSNLEHLSEVIEEAVDVGEVWTWQDLKTTAKNWGYNYTTGLIIAKRHGLKLSNKKI